MSRFNLVLLWCSPKEPKRLNHGDTRDTGKTENTEEHSPRVPIFPVVSSHCFRASKEPRMGEANPKAKLKFELRTQAPL